MRLRWVLLPLVLVLGCSQGTTDEEIETIMGGVVDDITKDVFDDMRDDILENSPWLAP